MNYNSIDMNEIVNKIKRNQLTNLNRMQLRKDKIYSEIPRIYEIDQEISSSSLYAAKARILNSKDLSMPNLDELKKKNHKLSQEKKNLLEAYGYNRDYLDELFTCPKCKDSGYIDNKPCSCLKQMIIDEMYLQSNLQNILSKENFDTFSLDYYSKAIPEGRNYSPYQNMSKILEHSKNFAEQFDKKHGNILIYGETGLGKTFLTNCIAKKLLDTGHTVLYLSANELFENILSKYIMSGKKTDELSSIYDYIYNTELLVIDDLGTELTNSFTLSQLFEIINKRALSGLSTLISTNLSMKQLQERYTERIMSRLVADYMIFYVYGDNIRYQKRKAMINKSNETK